MYVYLFGGSPGIRTPTNGFGDRYTALILATRNLAETVRFELTVPFDTTVFKTVLLNRALARFHNLVEIPGIEPGVPEGGGFTVHCITIDASSPYLVPQRRLELLKFGF